MNNLTVVEKQGQRVLTTKQLAEVYGADIRNISNNFKRNENRFIEGKHYYKLEGEELKEFKAIHLKDESLKFVSVLYLWTERGALRHAKILDTEQAWEVYEKLEDTYFRVKSQALQTKQLSPQLQLLINLELEQKQIKQELQGIRDVISLDTTSWRTDSRKLITKIANKMGGYEYIRDVNAEIYRLLDQRMAANVKQRLTNKRRRMADEGICKSKRDKLNKLDVIADDKKLIEGYVAIVKEMAVKNGVA